MLGQLFSSLAPARRTQARQQSYLHTLSENNHTYNLLFPDVASAASSPYSPSAGIAAAANAACSGHDTANPNTELDPEKHIRIIVAQDEVGALPRTVLFDSRPGSPRTESPIHHPVSAAGVLTRGGRALRDSVGPNTSTASHGYSHSRRGSLVSDTNNPPRSPTVGAFQRVRTRTASISSMPNIDEYVQSRNRESDELIKTCLDCMFGNTAMSYRGPSNKLHIVPLEPRPIDKPTMGSDFPVVDPAYGSLGRAEGRKRSNLVKSYTASNIPPDRPSTSGLNSAVSPVSEDGFHRNGPSSTATGGAGNVPSSSKEPRRRTILITRTFSVALPDDNGSNTQDLNGLRTSTPQSSLGKGNSFPFPAVGPSSPALNPQQRRLKQRKSPMYAITIIIQLPTSPPPASVARPSSRGGFGSGLGSLAGQRYQHHSAGGTNPNMGHESSAYSLASSLDSDRRNGWSLVDSSFSADSLLSASYSSDVDERVDVIGQHWDVITRTLTHLQLVVQDRILVHFKASELSSPPIIPPPRAPPSNPRGGGSTGIAAHREHQSSQGPSHHPTAPPPPPLRKIMKLQTNALALDAHVIQAVSFASERITRGILLPRVVAGQDRWGAWLQEVRWLGRWAGGKEQNFFLFNLMTAFLGHHTGWLNILGPRPYRRRHREQQRFTAGEDLTISSRTIIVSKDKFAVRRLIFLLAAFLPSSSPAVIYEGASPARPSTSASLRGYSQSPPTNVSASRQQSLRRTINQRRKESYSNMRLAGSMPSMSTGPGINQSTHPNPTEERQIVSSVTESSDARSSGSRHSSVASSVRTGLTIPAMSDSLANSKGSVATTSTVTPEIASASYFSAQGAPSEIGSRQGANVPNGDSSVNHGRPGSSGSLASANLMNNLQRRAAPHPPSQGGVDQHSQSGRRWGNFINFWGSSGRRGSTDPGDLSLSTDEGLGITGLGGRQSTNNPVSSNKLQQMVRELEMENLHHDDDIGPFDPVLSPRNEMMASSSIGIPASAARAIPERPKAPMDLTLKLSINENDGVIDVDVPLPSFGSPLHSPLIGGFNSASSFDGSSYDAASSSLFSLPQRETEQPVNVTGWVSRFHPDFVLQGVSPYSDLERDVRRAMSAEPTPLSAAQTPGLDAGSTEKWVDVCTSIIADATTFTLKRLRLRRRVKLIPVPSQSAITPGLQGLPHSQYGNPYTKASSHRASPPPMTELHLEERFSEEQVMDMDETLVDAIERILATPDPTPSRAESDTSSRSSSLRGRRPDRRKSEVEVTLSCAMPVNYGSVDTAGAGINASTGTINTRNDDDGTIIDSTSATTAVPVSDLTKEECKTLVFTALESVVKSVAAERARTPHVLSTCKKGPAKNAPLEKKAVNKTDDTTLPSTATDSSARVVESSLREGIRKWLVEVEDVQ